jgi:acyl-CoA synthetase (AMP-forming)/AMP-acid ligase II
MTQGYDTDTIQWTDGIVGHDPSAFDLERAAGAGGECWAWADRAPSVVAMLEAAVERAPDRTAFVYPEYDRETTYEAFDRRVRRLAAGLQDAGVGPGDDVSLLLSNRPAFVETLFACLRLGAVAAPINTRLSPREFASVLSDTEPTALVTEADLLDTVLDADYDLEGTLLSVTDGDEGTPGRPYASLFDDEAAVPAPEVEPADTAVVLYTSGTTGRPKGCPISQFNLVNAARNYVHSFETDDALRTLVVVPLFHGAGLTSNLLHTLAQAGTLVVTDGAGPDEFLAAVEGHRIEYTLAVPTTYVLAADQADPSAYDLSSLETASYGGAPMPAESVRRLREVFPGVDLCDAYGTTETTAGLVTMCPDAHTDERAESVGLPAPPIELAVVDEDREPLGPDTVGELAIRGPIVVSGYRDRPEETAEAFADGWHYTGDLASIDEAGFVELKGRRRDTVVRGGENVFVVDVEEVLTGHEKVLEASVTGFPDEVLGERVLAAVVPKPEVRLTEEELRAQAAERLADFKVPEVIRIVDELPRNPGGKVLKDELVPEPLQHGIRAGGGE